MVDFILEGKMIEAVEEERVPVLIVDDDEVFCELVRDYLKPRGYRVEFALDGDTGLMMASISEYEAIILDVMLPSIDGFEVLRRIRQTSEVPVLMLTSRGEEVDRISGLEMGADDYLPKTFSTRELLARLRAVTRRANRGAAVEVSRQAQTIRVGALVIDEHAHRATFRDTPLDLTGIEFKMLLCLAKSQGRILSREELLESTAGRAYEVFDRAVDVHVSALRRKLGEDLSKPRFILTVRGKGYMMPSRSECG